MEYTCSEVEKLCKVGNHKCEIHIRQGTTLHGFDVANMQTESKILLNIDCNGFLHRENNIWNGVKSIHGIVDSAMCVCVLNISLPGCCPKEISLPSWIGCCCCCCCCGVRIGRHGCRQCVCVCAHKIMRV